MQCSSTPYPPQSFLQFLSYSPHDKISLHDSLLPGFSLDEISLINASSKYDTHREMVFSHDVINLGHHGIEFGFGFNPIVQLIRPTILLFFVFCFFILATVTWETNVAAELTDTAHSLGKHSVILSKLKSKEAKILYEDPN